MAERKRSRGSTRIDTVPLPETVAGMKTVKGRIVEVRGRFVFRVSGEDKQIPIVIEPAPKLRQLVGKDVVGIVARGGEIVGIGAWPAPEAPKRIRPPRILCYIPAPETLQGLAPGVRDEVLRGLVREGIVTQEFVQEFGLEG